MRGTEEASKIWIGGSAKNRILALVKELIHLLSVFLSLIKRTQITMYPKKSVWGFGYPCASRTMLRKGLLTVTVQRRINLEDRVLN